MRKIIENELDKIGIKKSLSGYSYITEAVLFMLEAGEMISVKEVYFFTAECFLKNPFCVERNIRFCIEEAWKNGSLNYINELFGYTVSSERGKPTNSEFLFLLAQRVRELL